MADACCQTPCTVPIRPCLPLPCTEGGRPPAPPQLCPPCSREGIQERKGGLWCVSSYPALWERVLEGVPPAGGLAGLAPGRERGCQPPPWIRDALCTWEMWGGHGCRGGHCPAVLVSCGPHSVYAIAMGHEHVPLPVPRVGRDQGHRDNWMFQTLPGIESVWAGKSNLGDWMVMLRPGGCPCPTGGVVGVCLSGG